MKLQLTKYISTKNHIEVMLLHEKIRSNASWKTPQGGEEGLENMNGEKKIIASK